MRALAPADMRLGLSLELPDMDSGGGHPVTRVGDDSPMAGIVQAGDALVLVDEVPVTMLTQARAACGKHMREPSVTR